MIYYKVHLSTNKKVIGKGGFPQCKGVPNGLTYKIYDKPNSMTNLNNHEFPDFIPNLIWELEDDSFLTEVISPSMIKSRGLLVNEKVKIILENSNLHNVTFFTSTIIHKKKYHVYFWMHILDSKLKGVDFEYSTFIEVDLFGNKVKDLKIHSSQEYQNAWSNTESNSNFIQASCLKMDNEYSKYDMIYSFNLSQEILISHDLFLKIKSVTGLDFVKLNLD